MITREEALNKIADRLQEKISGQHPCTICNETKWIIGEPINVIIQKNLDKFLLDGETYPLVTLICGNCGNTHFLNVRILGFSTDDLNYENPSQEHKDNLE